MFFSAAKPNKYLYYLSAVAASSIFFIACTAKDYPVRQPFVYQTNINIQGKYTTDEKKQLKSQLYQQLHDSIQVRKQQKFIFFQVLKNPPKYDSINADKSKLFMQVLLNSLGYYRDSISYDTTMKIVDDQYRTTVNFNVVPGKLVRFDSVWYNLLDSITYTPQIGTLQKLTINSLGEAAIKKGDPFSKPLISSELDRLSDVYRNNGFLRFTKEELLGVWDTVGIALLRPTLDPIEQAQQLEALKLRRENPTADLEIRLRPGSDTTHFTRYYVGNVSVYPDLNNDTALYRPTIETLSKDRYQFISYEKLFIPRKLVRYIYLHRGDLYRQSNYLKTQNKFNSLGAWRLVTINQIPRVGQDTVDFEIKLTQAEKFSTSANLEVSRNQGNILAEGNLFGTGITLGLTNRNFAKGANQATTNLRYGIELSSKLDSIQTQQYTVSHTIQFPRAIPGELLNRLSKNADTRTSLILSGGFTNRKNYYNVKTITASWGYEFSWKNNLLAIRIPNIEYNFLQRGVALNDLINSNRSYKYIFNDGLITSSIVNWTHITGNKRWTNVLRLGGEVSGLISHFFRNQFLDSNLYPFVKLDAEFSQTYKIRRSALAWRFFGGIGYELPSSHNRNNLYLPFFRQYYAGGASSMRGWGLRKLGPGSTIKSFSPTITPERFGDMRLELNGEYRFYLTQVYGYTLEGALFTDIGNIWFVRKNPDFVDGEFNLSRLGKDIAVDAGTGLRIDFGFLKVRLDYAYKVKDPSPDNIAAQNKLFYNWKYNTGQFQLGIDYPF